MSWNLASQINDLTIKVRDISATSLTNPLTTNLSLGGNAINDCSQIVSNSSLAINSSNPIVFNADLYNEGVNISNKTTPGDYLTVKTGNNFFRIDASCNLHIKDPSNNTISNTGLLVNGDVNGTGYVRNRASTTILNPNPNDDTLVCNSTFAITRFDKNGALCYNAPPGPSPYACYINGLAKFNQLNYANIIPTPNLGLSLVGVINTNGLSLSPSTTTNIYTGNPPAGIFYNDRVYLTFNVTLGAYSVFNTGNASSPSPVISVFGIQFTLQEFTAMPSIGVSPTTVGVSRVAYKQVLVPNITVTMPSTMSFFLQAISFQFYK